MNDFLSSDASSSASSKGRLSCVCKQFKTPLRPRIEVFTCTFVLPTGIPIRWEIMIDGWTALFLVSSRIWIVPRIFSPLLYTFWPQECCQKYGFAWGPLPTGDFCRTISTTIFFLSNLLPLLPSLLTPLLDLNRLLLGHGDMPSLHYGEFFTQGEDLKAAVLSPVAKTIFLCSELDLLQSSNNDGICDTSAVDMAASQSPTASEWITFVFGTHPVCTRKRVNMAKLHLGTHTYPMDRSCAARPSLFPQDLGKNLLNPCRVNSAQTWT